MESNDINLEGTVYSIVFHNNVNGYTVLDLATDDETLVTVVGALEKFEEGERLILKGQYTTHKKFGLQFQANYYERKLPTTKDGIEKYLASGLVKGVKQSLAKKIVDTFGKDTFEVIESDPERLAEIKGISRSKAIQISNSFRQSFMTKKVSDFLTKFGIGYTTAIKATKKWGVDTLSKIKENPYILCGNGINLPFDSVEKVAYSLGFKKDCYERLSAGFFDVLNTALLDGHTCLLDREFFKKATFRLSLPQRDLDTAFKRISDEKSIIAWQSPEDLHTYVYLRSYYDAEHYIAMKVYSMSTRKPPKVKNHSKIISMLEKDTGIFYNGRQKEAISMAIDSQFMVLTGGPGTGKTTTLNGIIGVLENIGLKVKITAPTGRATKRITEITGHDAMTIHRLLEVNYDEDGNTTFNHNEHNPLRCDAIIVDEMSMVDTILFESLLKAVDTKCKVILVGDSDQLPSVSAGTVLKDLLSSGVLDVIELNEVFRQAQKSAIITNAHNVIKGEYPNIYLKDNDFFFLQRLNYKSAQDTIVELWKDRLPKTYDYSPIDDIQVLCPSRKGNLGTVTLNKLMQDAINPKTPHQREVRNEVYTFRVHDKVMQIKNDYSIEWQKGNVRGAGIYNGDMGYIRNVTSSGVSVDFDGRMVNYSTEMLDQLELAYAITIHKSQGSEFEVVVMPMLNNFKMLSYRNLLYTGITRAKRLFIVVGSKNELFAMVDNDRQVLRYSNLRCMIRDVFGEY
jgi:exodeoxyribonuclease V alpha subunit